jgi:hypothetical protein
VTHRKASHGRISRQSPRLRSSVSYDVSRRIRDEAGQQILVSRAARCRLGCRCAGASRRTTTATTQYEQEFSPPTIVQHLHAQRRMLTRSPTSIVILHRNPDEKCREKPVLENLEDSVFSLDRKPRVPSRTLSRSTRAEAPVPCPVVSRRAVKDKAKQRRRVRFCVDENDEIIEQCMPQSVHPLEPRVRWWTAGEMEKIQRQAACVAEFCLNCRPEYSRTATELLAFCAATRQDNDRYHHDHVTFSRDPAVASFVSGTARGLEQTLVPILQKRRRNTLHATLEFQDRVQRLSVDQRWDLIARQYKAHSEYASLWSRVLADGDARVRASYWDES